MVNFKLSRLGYKIFSFFNQRFYMELFYNKYVTYFILNLGGLTTKVLDKGSVELLGPYGLEKGLSHLSHVISRLSVGGNITTFGLYILLGLMSYILVPYLSESSILILIIFGVFALFALSTIDYSTKETSKYIVDKRNTV